MVYALIYRKYCLWYMCVCVCVLFAGNESEVAASHWHGAGGIQPHPTSPQHFTSHAASQSDKGKVRLICPQSINVAHLNLLVAVDLICTHYIHMEASSWIGMWIGKLRSKESQ